MATINSEVATGRRINGLDGFMDVDPHCPPAAHVASSVSPVRCEGRPSMCQDSPPHSHPPHHPCHAVWESPVAESPCFHSAASPAHRSQWSLPDSLRRSKSPASPRSTGPSPAAPRHRHEEYSYRLQHPLRCHPQASLPCPPVDLPA